MVRLISLVIGAGFVFVLALALFFTAKDAIQNPAPHTAEHEFHLHPEDIHLSSAGWFGKFDRQQVQRGFQVYKEVCAACHSLKYVAFRDLQKIGYSEAEVKAIANQWVIEQPSVNPETGEAATRKNLPSDHFPSPFANEVAARAANANALPPDLSLMAKAREDGSNYIHALITGYRDQPAELLKKFPDAKTPEGLHYNPYFANLNIASEPYCAAAPSRSTSTRSSAATGMVLRSTADEPRPTEPLVLSCAEAWPRTPLISTKV